MARGIDVDDVPSGSNRDRNKRPSDVIDIYKFKPEKATRLRPLPGGVFLYGGHWVKVRNKAGKETQFYTQCMAFDASTGKRAGGNGEGHCPWCDLAAKYKGSNRFSVDAYMNMMDVMAAKKFEKAPRPTEDEIECKHKIKDSETETPVRAVRLPMGAMGDLKKLKDQNRSGEEDEDGLVSGEAYGVSDPEHGAIISITFSPDEAPAKKYSISLAKRDHAIPVSWKKFLRWDLSELVDPIDEEEMQRDAEGYLKRNKDWLEELGGGDEDEGKSKSKKKRTHDDDDDEDDEPPRRTTKKRSVEEDDDLDEDEDEDDEPKSRKKPAARKKAVEEDDDDWDEPVSKKKSKSRDDDEDEDEDEPAPKSKRAPAKKKVEDDDDDFDDDDEDDEPPRRSKAKAKKRPVDDDEDEDDDL
jgi:hypothetical protein